MAEYAAGAGGGAAWAVFKALWTHLRYRLVNVELCLEPGGPSGPGPKRPKAAGHRVAWWGAVVIRGNAPDTIREYQVTLTVPKDIFHEWRIGWPTLEGGSSLWQLRESERQHQLTVAGQIPIIPRTPRPVGQYEWMLVGSHEYEPQYVVAYEIAAQRRKWTGELPIRVTE